MFMVNSYGTAGTTVFDIQINGNSIYSTMPYISYPAPFPGGTRFNLTSDFSTAGVFYSDPTTFTKYDSVRIYVFSAGTGMKGAKCSITAA